MQDLNLEDIRDAARALSSVVRPTPLIQSFKHSRFAGTDVYLKPENLQRTGSFKVRGAYNKIRSLTEEERSRGVIASSAGNHAQGVALAAEAAGIHATIVMPLAAPLTKVLRTRGYGAEVVLHGEFYEAAYEQALTIQAERGATFVHPFNDPSVIAGQGTIGLEIFDEMPDVDTVLVPIGGGGLISGVAIALKALNPKIRIVGVQASGAPAALRALDAGKLVSLDRADTIADGIKVRTLGELTYSYISRFVDEIVLVDDEEIGMAMVDLLESSKLVVEGAGAVTVAALMNHRVENLGRKACAILGGGNVDINLVARVIERGLSRAGRYALLQVRIQDQPGQLLKILEVLAARRVNILDVVHYRSAWRVPIGSVEVEMLVETRDSSHAREIAQLLRVTGLEARIVEDVR